MSLRFMVRMEHGGHKDLHDSGRRRVTPYIHERCVWIVVCCIKRVCLGSVAVRPLYGTRAYGYMQPQGPIGGPRAVMSVTSTRVIVAIGVC
jgi:hypothetical protein